jgi:hypothetical protein
VALQTPTPKDEENSLYFFTRGWKINLNKLKKNPQHRCKSQ